MRCYFINLDKCKQRCSFIISQINNINNATFQGNIINVSSDNILSVYRFMGKNKKKKSKEFHEKIIFYRVNAYDGKKVVRSQLQYWRKKGLLASPRKVLHSAEKTGKLYNGGRLCTFMSHINTWTHVYQTTTDPYVLILEDDVIIPNKIQGACDMLVKKIKEANIKWDVIFIGHAGNLKGKVVIENLLLKPSQGAWPDTNHGMFAYLLKVRSIPKLLRMMLPIPGEPSFAHVDNHLRRFYGQAKCYYTLANVVKHMDNWMSVRVQYDKPYNVKS